MKPHTFLRTVAAAFAVTAASASAATPTLLVDHGILTGANNVSIGASFYDVRFVDGTCNAVFDGCSSSASFTFQDVDAAQVAARAISSTVLVDGPDGLFDTDPALTFGCGDPATCAVFVPYIVSAPTSTTFTSVVAHNFSGPDNATLSILSQKRVGDTTASDSRVFAVFTPSASNAVAEPASIALLGIGMLGVLRVTRGRRRTSPASLGR